MCMQSSVKNNYKKISSIYKLLKLYKNINHEKTIISWFFLVVNGRSDISLKFLELLKTLGFYRKRNYFLNVENLFFQEYKFKFKGEFFNFTFDNLKVFVDFFLIYYAQYENLVYNLKTFGFCYSNNFYVFVNTKVLSSFRKNVIDPLKMNLFSKNLLCNIKKPLIKIYMYLNLNLYKFGLLLFKYCKSGHK